MHINRHSGGANFILCIVVTICIAMLIIELGFYFSPLKQAHRQLSLGKKYLGELKYEDAVLEFQEAYNIAPNNKKIVTTIHTILIEMTETAESTDDTALRTKILRAVILFKSDNTIFSDVLKRAQEIINNETYYTEADVVTDTNVEDEDDAGSETDDSSDDENEEMDETENEVSSNSSTSENSIAVSVNSASISGNRANVSGNEASVSDNGIMASEDGILDLEQFFGKSISDVSHLLEGESGIWETEGGDEVHCYYKENETEHLLDYNFNYYLEDNSIITSIRTNSGDYNLCGVNPLDNQENISATLESSGWILSYRGDYGMTYHKGNRTLEYTNALLNGYPSLEMW